MEIRNRIPETMMKIKITFFTQTAHIIYSNITWSGFPSIDPLILKYNTNMTCYINTQILKI